MRYAIEEGDLRFEFNAIMGTEVLSRVGGSEIVTNLTSALPDDADRLRAKLMRKLGVSSLAELRANHRDTIARLTELGYL